MALFTDNFNRANGALGPNWTASAGSIVISSGQTSTVTGGDFCYYNGQVYGDTDVSFIPILGTPILVWRSDGVAGSYCGLNGYFVYIANDTSYYFYKNINGSLLSFGNAIGVGTGMFGKILRITHIGNEVTLYVDGILVTTATDTSFASGYAGISGAATGAVSDDFSVAEYGVITTSSTITGAQSITGIGSITL